MMAQTSSPIWARALSRLLNSAKRTPGMSGSNGSWYLGRGVAANEPKSRPWKAEVNDKMWYLSLWPCSRA